MFGRIGSLFRNKPEPEEVLLEPVSIPEVQPIRRVPSERKVQTFTKVFRWQPREGQPRTPASVEVVGTFTQWQPVPLSHDSALNSWHVTLHHLQSNKTHHYMLLADGEPIHDHACDGLAIPHGPEEERFAIRTEKGSRVFMLFAQTK
jgi:hypothetical protein